MTARLLPIKLADEQLERVRRNHHAAIEELQALPLVNARLLKDVALTDGVATPIAHSFTRPVFALPSPVRGAVSTGRIEEVRDGTHDRAKYVVLKATGWGATIKVDILVVPL